MNVDTLTVPCPKCAALLLVKWPSIRCSAPLPIDWPYAYCRGCINGPLRDEAVVGGVRGGPRVTRLEEA